MRHSIFKASGGKSHRVAGRIGSVLLILTAGVVLSACDRSANKIKADGMTTQSVSAASSVPSFKKTDELAKKWQANPANVPLGLAYADNLGKLDQRPAQAEVLRTVANRNHDNAAVQNDIGKKLLAMGDGQGAAAILERAVQLQPANWETLSALGTAYDQQTRHADARAKYNAALQINPDELSVRNNLAMSYALQGRLPEAEKILRELMMKPAAASMPRIRQNLALVVGLQGRFEESQKIASEDLPPDQVQANLAYIQQMLTRPNTWAQLSDNTTSQN